jgi:hypothetical protein
MKRPVLNKSFYHFFFGFLAIIALAFGVMMIAGSQAPQVDNVAQPQ